jgi:hypothetical protein
VSNYSQSLHRLQNPRVPLHLSRRGLRRSVFDLSIGPPNLCQSTVFFSAPASVFFPGEKPPLLHLEFHRLFLFLSMSRLPLPSLLFPSGGAPSPPPPPPAQPLPTMAVAGWSANRLGAAPTELSLPARAPPRAPMEVPCVEREVRKKMTNLRKCPCQISKPYAGI